MNIRRNYPNLISRRQFNARRKLTARLGEDISKDVAITTDGSENVFCIDSKPVKVCRNARAKRCAMGRDNIEAAPDRGTVYPKACITTGISFTQSVEEVVSYTLMI